MGIEYFDKYSWRHFVGGFFTLLVIYPQNKWTAFFLSNLIHIIFEFFIEKDINPINGKILEGMKNHIMDVILFLAGSIISMLLYDWVYKNIFYKYCWFRGSLTLVVLAFWVQETGRDIFPYSWPIGAAYHIEDQS